ncbi:cobyric acid synthase [Limnochorda pilosa]|uniref:Cobyric acid synthase n=1 Tax=Limnochorda pilosa TaxID=1555112 RepID=A0A0K2SQQ6_LIMPI|nr:cobyric acid synthase [Limnochorda pilosa]BAS29332.1 cobyric acid synthase [Limnochorda pilosa]
MTRTGGASTWARALMVQGTGSHVGKSLIAAGLCRIFAEDGHRVAPFKAQNMSLNAWVTPEGGEISWAQAVQARAAGLPPHVDMNPVLLKPVRDTGSQVVLLGEAVGTLSAVEYQAFKPRIWQAVLAALDRLRAAHEIVVIEGAGSPAEVNLREGDIANMAVAEAANAPVLLAADIDRGGALAWVVGTLELLAPEERARVRGILINKFRGDRSLLQPGLDFLEERTGVPVLGVIPYLPRIGLPEEDTLPDERPPAPVRPDTVHVVVLRHPHLANFTDFDALAGEPDVALRFVGNGEPLGRPDVVVLPGSKTTLADLEHLRAHGYDAAIHRLAAEGSYVVGLCGGYQMMGLEVADPLGVEGPSRSLPGLGLLPVRTVLRPTKLTALARGESLLPGMEGPVEGYEIHMGESERAGGSSALRLQRRNAPRGEVDDGCWAGDGRVFGTYLHGLFDHPGFRRSFLNRVRAGKGLPTLPPAPEAPPDEPYRRLAQALRESVDIEAVYRLMG